MMNQFLLRDQLTKSRGVGCSEIYFVKVALIYRLY